MVEPLNCERNASIGMNQSYTKLNGIASQTLAELKETPSYSWSILSLVRSGNANADGASFRMTPATTVSLVV
jgi:hypothetical protein